MSMSNYLESALCAWIKGTAMPTAPSAVYVGLFNGDPTDTGAAGTEVTTTIRAAGRPAVTFGTEANGVITNSAIADFGNAAGAATVTHFAIFTAASAGNALMVGALSSSVSVASGAATSFPVGSLSLTFD